ncbi:hypothetical protein V5O48_000129 [Marasmius crinis-equi]|uniref:PB1 domain-containing protein n=1 Tax=Marasmius crinis-equi TaxID=585013 RepID=A0ABR3G270_9AGAR
MSLKAELETWAAALKAYDEEDFEKALDLFSRIADASKILTNMGLIYATLGEHEAAVEKFIEATGLDTYLAVAYFQCGVSNFLLARYDLAYKDFEEALLYLRGNQAINYEQLGLKFRLFSAEVLFNKGLAQIYMGRTEEGLADMQEAKKEKATDEHNVIDDAIADRGEGYTVFSIPVGVLYRPPEKKLKNAAAKSYMGKPVLIAASDARDVTTGFSGISNLRQGVTPLGVYIDPAAQEQTTLERSLSRSRTVPAQSVSKPDNDARPADLSRSKTTLNVPSNARDRTSPVSETASAPVTRANTISGRGPPGAGMGGPVRGLSVKKSSPVSPKPVSGPPPPAKEEPSSNRITEFYDDYLDSYGASDPPPPVPSMPAPAGPDRVAAWARTNANPSAGYPPMRNGSRSAPGSSYAPSSYGGGSMRRKLTRRGTSSARSRAISTYEEEEEGYVSGDYDDGPFELVKIRVKLHYKDDVRGMALAPETPFDEFMDKVCAKFSRSFGGLGLKFRDEDGGKVTLADESDYELAIETARESSKGKPEGKLEIWCTDN